MTSAERWEQKAINETKIVGKALTTYQELEAQRQKELDEKKARLAELQNILKSTPLIQGDRSSLETFKARVRKIEALKRSITSDEKFLGKIRIAVLLIEEVMDSIGILDGEGKHKTIVKIIPEKKIGKLLQNAERITKLCEIVQKLRDQLKKETEKLDKVFGDYEEAASDQMAIDEAMDDFENSTKYLEIAGRYGVNVVSAAATPNAVSAADADNISAANTNPRKTNLS